MGLVDYSESDSSGSEAKAPSKPTSKQNSSSTTKKPFQKVVDRSNPGKIVVNLPQTKSTASTNGDEPPPAKKARTAGGGRFSGFNSFLPPPKNLKASATSGASSVGGSKPRPGINLKTSAAPGFSRDGGEDDDTGETNGDETGLPQPAKQQPAPSIPEGQLAAEDVKVTGKPMMFKPLSVSRKPIKKKKTSAPTTNTMSTSSATQDQAAASTGASSSVEPTAPPAKKPSLFSVHVEEPSERAAQSSYQPLFSTTEESYTNHDDSTVTSDYNSYVPPESHSAEPAPESLDSVINDMNLSASARRELFGRSGAPVSNIAASRVVNFNMDTEYQHNEELRASGEQQIHNPVRSIMGGGKHSLQKLVRNVQDQKDALEDSFAKGKTNRKEASSRYGW